MSPHAAPCPSSTAAATRARTHTRSPPTDSRAGPSPRPAPPSVHTGLPGRIQNHPGIEIRASSAAAESTVRAHSAVARPSSHRTRRRRPSSSGGTSIETVCHPFRRLRSFATCTPPTQPHTGRLELPPLPNPFPPSTTTRHHQRRPHPSDVRWYEATQPQGQRTGARGEVDPIQASARRGQCRRARPVRVSVLTDSTILARAPARVVCVCACVRARPYPGGRTPGCARATRRDQEVSPCGCHSGCGGHSGFPGLGLKRPCAMLWRSQRAETQASRRSLGEEREVDWTNPRGSGNSWSKPSAW